MKVRNRGVIWLSFILTCSLATHETFVAASEGTFVGFVIDNRDMWPAEQGGIAGTVWAINGTALANVEVFTDGGYLEETSTNGYYSLSEVPAGTGYLVTAHAPGYAPKSIAASVTENLTTRVDFNLEPITETYSISAWYPSAGVISEIGEKGVANRFYRVRTTSGDIPRAIVRARWEVRKGGALVQASEHNTNAGGEVGVWVDVKDIASVGDTLSGEIVSLNGVSIAQAQRPTFQVNVAAAPFEVSTQQSVTGELRASLAVVEVVVGKENGFELAYPCASNTGDAVAGMEIMRKTTSKVGVGASGVLFEAGAEYKVTNFKAGAAVNVGADAEVYAIVKHHDQYDFNPTLIYDSPDWNESAAAFIALNDVFGLASKDSMIFDPVLIHILTWLEQAALDQGGPLTALNTAYTGSETGIGVGGGASASASVVVGAAGQTQGRWVAGLEAGASGVAGGEMTLDMGYNRREPNFVSGMTTRMEGSVRVALGAGVKLWNSGAPGRPENATKIGNGLLYKIPGAARENFGFSLFSTLSSWSWTGATGLEYRNRAVFSGNERRLTHVIFDVAPFSRVNGQTTLRRVVFTASSDDPSVLARFGGAAGPMGAVVSVISSAGKTFGAFEHEELMFGFIDAWNQIANGPDADRLKIMVEVYDEPAIEIGSHDLSLKGKLLGTGGKVKLGANTHETFKYPVFRGIWKDSRFLVTEDYEQAGYQKPDVPDYKETNQKLLDTVITQPIEDAFEQVMEKVLAGVEVLVDAGGRWTLQFAKNTVSTGSNIVVTRWDSLTDQDGQRMATSSRKARIAQRILRAAQEQAGIDFGVGGFLNVQVSNGTVTSSPTLTMTYTDEELQGADETGLAIFRYNDVTGEWLYLGGTVNPTSNTVTGVVWATGTYSLAPVAPDGEIAMVADPGTIPADGVSETMITCEPLLDSAGETAPDGTIYTITTDLGTIITNDAMPQTSGTQVAAGGGSLVVTLRSGLIGGMATVRAESLIGRAKGHTRVLFTDSEAPVAPRSVFAMPFDEGAWVSWKANSEPDMARYVIHYATHSGEPYDGKATIHGQPSPVSVGLTTRSFLPGLVNGTTYYVTVTAVDTQGNESPFSEEVRVMPGAPRIEPPIWLLY